MNATPLLVSTLRFHVKEPLLCQAALLALKNQCTNSVAELVEDMVESGVLNSLSAVIQQYSDDEDMISLAVDCCIRIFHANGKFSSLLIELLLPLAVGKKRAHKDFLVLFVNLLRKYEDNDVDLNASILVVLLQLSKLGPPLFSCLSFCVFYLHQAIHRRDLADLDAVRLVIELMEAFGEEFVVVELCCRLIERLCATPACVESMDFSTRFSSPSSRLLTTETAIPVIMNTLSANGDAESIHFLLDRLLFRLASHPKAKKVIKANDGISILVTSMNNFEGPTKTVLAGIPSFLLIFSLLAKL